MRNHGMPGRARVFNDITRIATNITRAERVAGLRGGAIASRNARNRYWNINISYNAVSTRVTCYRARASIGM